MAVFYKCPNCGNSMTTQQEVPVVKCPYCGNDFNTHNQQPPQFTQADPQTAQQQSYGTQQQPYGAQQQSYAGQQQPPYGAQQQPYGAQPQYGYTPQPSNDIFANGPSGKSRGVAGLLAIFLGSLGIHYFYVGKTTPGIVFLLVSVLGGIFTCGAGTGVIGIIALVQGILIMCMSQQEFENKYVNPAVSFPLF